MRFRRWATVVAAGAVMVVTGVFLATVPQASAANALDSGNTIAFVNSSGRLETSDSSGTRDRSSVATGSASIAQLPAGGYEVAFVGSDGYLWKMAPDGGSGWAGPGLGVAPGTTPAIAADRNGGWRIAFHALGDHLWTIDSASHVVDTGVLVKPGTSPSIVASTVPGDYWIAFVGSDGYLWKMAPDGGSGWAGPGLGVAPGTTPAIAADRNGGWRIAFHALGDHLWTIDSASHVVDTGVLMKSGTNSPSISWMRAGSSKGFWIAFVGSDGYLWKMAPDGGSGWAGPGLGVAPDTIPAISTDLLGNWKIAFHALGDHLWTIGSAGHPVDTGLIVKESASPTITEQPGGAAGALTPQEIVSTKSGKCVSVEGDSFAAGARIVQLTCAHLASQHWVFKFAGPLEYQIVNDNSGLCLDDGAGTNGSIVTQQPCEPGLPRRQTWIMGVAKPGPPEPQVLLRTLDLVNGEWPCLDLPSGTAADGALIQVWQCILGQAPNQDWFIRREGAAVSGVPIDAIPQTIVSSEPGKCAAIESFSLAPGARMIQLPCTGLQSQRWIFDLISPSKYRVLNLNSGLCLDDGAGTNGTVVTQQPCEPGLPSRQTWVMGVAKQGPPEPQVLLRTLDLVNGEWPCLDLPNGTAGDGALIQVWQCVLGQEPNQAWFIRRS